MLMLLLSSEDSRIVTVTIDQCIFRCLLIACHKWFIIGWGQSGILLIDLKYVFPMQLVLLVLLIIYLDVCRENMG